MRGNSRLHNNALPLFIYFYYYLRLFIIILLLHLKTEAASHTNCLMYMDARLIKKKSRNIHLFIGVFCIKFLKNVPYLTQRKLATLGRMSIKVTTKFVTVKLHIKAHLSSLKITSIVSL